MKSPFTSILARLPKAAGFSLLVAAANLQAMPANLIGSYQADLVADSVVKGRLDVTLNSKGLATGKATMPNGKSYGFKFQLSEAGGGVVASDQTVYNKKGQTLALSEFAVNADGELTAEFESNIAGIPAQLLTLNGLAIATFSGKSGNVAPGVGAYTMAMLPSEGATAGTPAGAGYATFSVVPNGKLTYKGKLGDGTPITGSALPDVNGVYSLFKTVYSPGGLFVARLFLESLGLQEDQGYWNKPENQKDKKYPAGFSTNLAVHVAEWTKLAKKTVPGTDSGFTSSKNFAVDFSGEGLADGDFSTTLPDTARFTSTGAVQAVDGEGGTPAENNSKEWNKLWNVKVNPATGEFSGTQVLKTTVGSKTKSKKIKVNGVLLLDGAVGEEAFGLGQYLVTPTGGSEVSGLVSFSGPLEDNVAVASSGTFTFNFQRIGVEVNDAPLNGNINAVRPRHAPLNGTTATLVLSEDLTSATLSFRLGKTTKRLKLPHSGSVGAAPQTLHYLNVGMQTVDVQVYRNFAGEVTGVAVTFFDFLNPVAFAKQGYYQQSSGGITKK